MPIWSRYFHSKRADYRSDIEGSDHTWEVNEYFEESEEKNELKIKEKWMHKIQNLSREDSIYKDMKLDIETIMKIKLSNDYYKFFV